MCGYPDCIHRLVKILHQVSQTISKMIDGLALGVVIEVQAMVNILLQEYSEFYNLCLVGFGFPIFQDYAKRFGTNFKFRMWVNNFSWGSKNSS